MEGTRRKDEEGYLERLARRTYPALVKYASSLCGTAQAQDVTQQACVAIFKDAARIRRMTEKEFLAWAKPFVRNAWRDERRKERRRRARMAQYRRLTRRRRTTPPDESIGVVERQLDARRLLAPLSPADARLIVLYFFHQQPASLIAARLGVASSTILRRIDTILRAIRRRLANCG